MKRKTLLIMLIFGVIIATLAVYTRIIKEPEQIQELIGENFDYAHKIYFKREPTGNYQINLNKTQNELDGGVLIKRNLLKDSVVNVYYWEFGLSRSVIWVGKTDKMNHEIIDALTFGKLIKF
ncbi:MAG: hypothetical protein JXQ96_12085 [Cyclobacteriaceae bacterium]